MVAGALLTVMVVMAGAADPFEAAKAKATEVENMAKLLEPYAGKCVGSDPVEEQECQNRAKAGQANFKGKTLYTNLGAGFERLMEGGEVNGNRALVVLTPVLDVGAEVALTFAKPQKLDKDGTIIVNKMPVEGVLLDDTLMSADVKRLVKTSQMNVEIVFTIKGPWQLKKKEGEVVKGLEIAVTAIRLSNRRSGKPVMSWVK